MKLLRVLMRVPYFPKDSLRTLAFKAIVIVASYTYSTSLWLGAFGGPYTEPQTMARDVLLECWVGCDS